jgi:hypothetical protein
VQIRKRKVYGKTFKTSQVQDKPNFNNIFKSYLGYCDLQGLHNSHDYFGKFFKIYICNNQAT